LNILSSLSAILSSEFELCESVALGLLGCGCSGIGVDDSGVGCGD
jgi:hypothetical protein